MAVYFLILIGSVVRVTGSGMGCPDWPRCFGRWTPPSSAALLPDNYKEIYAAAREKKNTKFAKYLKAFGFSETADKILLDKSVKTETDFNVTTAWIEYGNRLVGVAVGFLILALFLRSLKLRKTQPALFYLSVFTLVAVIFQGWFGSIVVSTNLTSWTITLHMLLALLIAAVLIKMLDLCKRLMVDPAASPGILPDHATRWILLACIATLLMQVVLGTEVRAGVDSVAEMLPRNGWIEAIGVRFLVHRSFSILVLLLHVILLMKLGKTMASKALPRALIILILGTLLTGVGMAWFSVPAVLQPFHLVLATGTFGVQLYLWYQWNNPKPV